jgi:XTP/dITP diphosphohydrolase
MTKLIFATNNKHKVSEIRAVLGNHFEIETLQEAGILIDIPEPHDTLEENAWEKVNVIYEMTSRNGFSEDTGLEIEALNGAPGVLSARYAGPDKEASDNIDRVLREMEGIGNRKAQFRTVIALILDGTRHTFEGVCRGHILEHRQGEAGFGYDPIFIPEGSDLSFAEMDTATKNKYSHRGKAVQQLIEFLQNHG